MLSKSLDGVHKITSITGLLLTLGTLAGVFKVSSGMKWDKQNRCSKKCVTPVKPEYDHIRDGIISLFKN